MQAKDKALKMAMDFLDGSYEAHRIRKACQEALDTEQVREDAVPAQEPLTQEKYEQLKNQSTQWTSSLPMFVHLINKHFGIDDGLDWGQK